MLRISKAVRDGSPVRKHGDKYVRCSSMSKVEGVYQEGVTQYIDTSKGLIKVTVPPGVVVQGPVQVNA